ncbi:MAG: hypothetical protein ABFD79_18765 [Phycisphaerales bacterium]
MPYIESTITAGKVKDITKYHTAKYKSPKRPKAENQNTTPERQAKTNERYSQKKLDLLINANFSENDLYLTLTYGNQKEEPEPKEAKKYLEKYIRKIRTLYKKMGVTLKYIAITEHKKRRIHHHLLINQIGIGINHIKKFWEHGFSKIQLYAGEPEDAERIANYFIKESGNAFNEDEKVHGLRWNSSKNLIHPLPVKKVVHASSWREIPKPPKGYYIAYVRQGFTESGYPYQHCRMIKI